MSRKPVPARIKVADYEFGKMTDRHGLFYWIAKPEWDAPSKEEAANGRFRVTRRTSNRPMLRVYLDHTFNGTECRWATVRLDQQKTVVNPSEVSFGNTVRVSDDNADQFAEDWAKIRAMIIDDPQYASLIGKVDTWTAGNADDESR